MGRRRATESRRSNQQSPAKTKRLNLNFLTNIEKDDEETFICPYLSGWFRMKRRFFEIRI